MGSDSVSDTIDGVGNDDNTLIMRCNKIDATENFGSTYSVDVYKADNNHADLKVQIVARNGTVLKEGLTFAPLGSVSIRGEC
jgi:hypothetical protein